MDRIEVTIRGWIAVSEAIPLDGHRVETKIVSESVGDWCYIPRIYSNGCWNVADIKYQEFDQIKFTPTHWRYYN